LEAWFAVITKPRSEALAEEHLRRQGYECLLPRVRRLVRNAAGLKPRIESLFPGYVFLRADPERDSLAPVRSTRGALGLVRFGAEPARIPQAVVDGIVQRMDAQDGFVHLAAPELIPGEAVRITDGAFAGWQGVFVARDGSERVRLLLQLLGMAREVVLPRAQLALRL